MAKAAKKGSRLRAALLNQQALKSKADAAKRAQQHSMKKKTNPKQNSRKPWFPYTMDDRILLIGEGNFSFAHSIAKKLGTGVNIVATAYDSESVVDEKYTDDASAHLQAFKDFGGTVWFDIDATRLGSYSQLCELGKFTHVVFNFPHAGAGIKDQMKNIQTNQVLLAGFFTSVQTLLTEGRPLNSAAIARRKQKEKRAFAKEDEEESEDEAVTDSSEVFEFEGAKASVEFAESDNSLGEGKDEDDTVETEYTPTLNRQGQIQVSLKSGLPYSQWNIKGLANACGLETYTTRPFDLRVFPGYQHRRTLGFKQGVSKDENQEIRDNNPKLYIFVKSSDKPGEQDEEEAEETQPKRKRRRMKDLAINSESFDYKSFKKKRTQ